MKGFGKLSNMEGVDIHARLTSHLLSGQRCGTFEHPQHLASSVASALRETEGFLSAHSSSATTPHFAAGLAWFWWKESFPFADSLSASLTPTHPAPHRTGLLQTRRVQHGPIWLGSGTCRALSGQLQPCQPASPRVPEPRGLE